MLSVNSRVLSMKFGGEKKAATAKLCEICEYAKYTRGADWNRLKSIGSIFVRFMAYPHFKAVWWRSINFCELEQYFVQCDFWFLLGLMLWVWIDARLSSLQFHNWPAEFHLLLLKLFCSFVLCPLWRHLDFVSVGHSQKEGGKGQRCFK